MLQIKKRSILAALIILLPVQISATADVILVDGKYHLLDYRLDDDLKVSGIIYVGGPWHYTTVDIVAGGVVGGNVSVGSLGVVNVLGGEVEGGMSLVDFGTINIIDGTVGGNVEIDGTIATMMISSSAIGGSIVQSKSSGRLFVSDTTIDGDFVTATAGPNLGISNVQVQGELQTIVSGFLSPSESTFLGGVRASNFSGLKLSNCYIGRQIIAEDHSVIALYGTDFKVDGVPVDYGRLSDYTSGHLTGLTYNGLPIDSDFLIEDYANIYLLPEPATLFLLAPGALMLRQKKKR